MADGNWSLAKAKAKLSEVVERALHEGPQHITRHGRPAVVVVPEDDWPGVSVGDKSLVDVLLDPAIRGVLRPGEEKLFERDRSSDRAPPEF